MSTARKYTSLKYFSKEYWLYYQAMFAILVVNCTSEWHLKGKLLQVEPSLVQIMAWSRIGDEPLSEPTKYGQLTKVIGGFMLQVVNTIVKYKTDI